MSEERQGLMSTGAYEDDGDAVIEMDLLPPRWLDVQDEVTEHLAHIAKQTRSLDQLHQKHVLPGFDDEERSSRSRSLPRTSHGASSAASRPSSG
jgi:syntaxin 16